MFHINEDEWFSVHDDLYFDDVFTNKLINTNKQVAYFNDVIAFDIETSSFEDCEAEDDYKDNEVYEYLLNTKIKITQSVFSDIPDFNFIRKSLFGRIFFSKSEGITIDSLYHELNSKWPFYFSEDIINPSDQLEQIVAVFYDNSPEKTEDDRRRSVMYVWQIAINGTVIIGRTWDEFIELTEQISKHFNLSEDRRMIIYVHSLAFEMEYIKDLFSWKKVFAISSRKPIYALTESGIEFRCSYMLSNLSLANVGESLHKYKVSKLVGDLDYDKVRHCETPLSDQEIRYCVNDVLVVSAYIKECMEQDHNDITKLPLTATGYCRNYVRKNCLVGDDKESQFKKYHEMIRHLTISGVEEYDQMNRAFAGGFTHCSCRHSGKTLYDVSSFDLISAYPAALCLEPVFPMSKGKVVPVTTYKELYNYCKLYCCIFDITFIDITPRYINENYISISKCIYKGSEDKWKKEKHVVTNNGRLVGADEITITLTDIDFEIICRNYKWEQIKIGTFRIYKRGYLPREIIMSILHLYKNKTELKGVDGKEDFYTKSKQLLNACYGMCVTSIIMPVHTFDNEHGWTVEHKDAEKEIKRYNKSKKRFLFYAWGIFCTAVVRKTIFSGILAFGDDYIYSDTDSIKAINADKHLNFIKAYNRMIERKIHLVSKHYNIPVDYFIPKTIKGVPKMLGIFENETEKGNWKMFKSLGAKRYMVLTCDDKLTITVSGVNKKHAVPYLLKKYGIQGSFEAFKNELTIPAEYTGKLTHYYLDDKMQGEVTDYLGKTITYTCMSGIYLEKASYKFSIESEYLDYLRSLRGVLV